MGLTGCNVQNMKLVVSFDFCRIWPFILEHIHKVFIKDKSVLDKASESLR